MKPWPAVEAIEATLKTLFPADVVVAAERLADDRGLFPEERAAVTGAVQVRLAEFAAGRRAARRVLAALGHPAVAVPMATDRAPIWPKGVAGSIAHAGGLAVAAGWSGAAIGIDIEPDAALGPDLWPVICTAADLLRLTSDDAGREVRRIFSAKEAVFKAQPAATRAMFGFDAVDIILENRGFRAQVLHQAGGFRSGQKIKGRQTLAHGLILSGVVG